MEFRHKNIEEIYKHAKLLIKEVASEGLEEEERQQNRYRIRLSKHIEECIKEKNKCIQ